MKEMLHSKILVGFVIFVLGFTYVNSIQMNQLGSKDTSQNDLVYH